MGPLDLESPQKLLMTIAGTYILGHILYHANVPPYTLECASQFCTLLLQPIKLQCSSGHIIASPHHDYPIGTPPLCCIYHIVLFVHASFLGLIATVILSVYYSGRTKVWLLSCLFQMEERGSSVM
jgi:hypothetical protein